MLSVGRERRPADRLERGARGGTEYSTFDWTMREILARAGFAVERVEPENRVMTHYLCLKA